jgi:hypothetical protein
MIVRAIDQLNATPSTQQVQRLMTEHYCAEVVQN